jgi:hypothetical protein
VYHTTRLKIALEQRKTLESTLALVGQDAIDLLEDVLRRTKGATELKVVFDIAAAYASPKLTRTMFELSQTARTRVRAKAWLGTHRAELWSVLVHEYVTQGALAGKAGRYLRAQRVDFAAEIREAAALYGPAVLARVESELLSGGEGITPASLLQMASSMAKSKVKKLPEWVLLSDLPPLTLGAWTFSDEERALVLLALAESTLEAPHELVVALRESIPAMQREPFVWRLFEQWLRGGAPSKEKWGFTSLGLLGDNMVSLKLTPYIREWPQESQTARAILGLDVLRTIGTDAAIQQINVLATKAKTAGLKKNATEAIDSIAEARNLTREQLEDRIIPDCGLDASGTAIFDFGPRQFTLVLDEEMKVRARFPDGTLKSDIAKPNSKDDPTKAEPAHALWKLTKKLVQDTAKAQVSRLERAMVGGRRWTVEEFQSLLLRHPLMVNMVRRLIWGGWNEAGDLVSSFRLAEDGTLADANDELLVLDGIDSVGVLHPLHLPANERTGWGQVFSDYAIVPPFPQASRETHTLRDPEKDTDKILRFADRKIEGPYLIFGLEGAGWQRSGAEDGGGYYNHMRTFDAAELTAVVEYEPGTYYGASPADMEPQTIKCAYFVKGVGREVLYSQHNKPIRLGDVDPIAISEVLRDLTHLYSKAV